MTTTELIIKGSFIGIGLFTIARWIYWKGWHAGADWARDYIFNELTKRNETTTQTRNVARKD